MKWSTALVFIVAIAGLIALALAPVPHFSLGVRMSTMGLVSALAFLSLFAP